MSVSPFRQDNAFVTMKLPLIFYAMGDKGHNEKSPAMPGSFPLSHLIGPSIPGCRECVMFRSFYAPERYFTFTSRSAYRCI